MLTFRRSSPSISERASISPRLRIARTIARWIAGRDLLASVAVRVHDADRGWLGFTGGPNDRDAGEIQQQYTDALEAWRKNPLAKRIVDTVTDYCLGDGLIPTAPGTVGRFLDTWWKHPKNNMPTRLAELSDELCRSGDLFLTLHRNPADGVSYVRPVPKDRIIRIETRDNDWETELAFYEVVDVGEPRRWLSLANPTADEADAVMVHYSVNRVVGALMGESDLGTMIPWLLRYSRMLEDRLRLHWAARAFLWIVTVPANRVREKQEQYRVAPDAGTVIIKDESEQWDAVNPDLKGFDAQFDLRAVRQMIDAGAGLPPHWRGEPHNVSLATSRSMDRAAARHLRRRQLYLRFVVVDLAHTAYMRAWQLGKVRATPNRDSIVAETADIDRQDNQELATASRDIAQALQVLTAQLPGRSDTLRRLILRLVLRFAGEPLDEPTLDTILQELEENPAPAISEASPGTDDDGRGDPGGRPEEEAAHD